jgi:hypothetical protein
MHSDIHSRLNFHDGLQAGLGQLVDRVVAAEPGEQRSRLLRWALLALAVFAAWRILRALRKGFWAMFGIAMALWWSGGAWFLFR